MPTPIIFLIFAVIAEAIGTITGFGATTILLPVALFIMPVREAIVIVAFFHFLGTTWRTAFFAREINIKVALVFGIPSLIFSFIGASLLHLIDIQVLTKIVGLLLIFYALYSLLKHKIVISKRWSYLIVGGGVVGFLAGLIGTAGALRGAFLTSWNLPKKKYLGTAAFMGLGADVARVVAYNQTGIFTLNFSQMIILGITALIGTYIGKVLLSKVKSETFAKIIFVGLFLVGVRFLF